MSIMMSMPNDDGMEVLHEMHFPSDVSQTIQKKRTLNMIQDSVVSMDPDAEHQEDVNEDSGKREKKKLD